MASFSFPLEFRLLEREIPSGDAAASAGTRRPKIKEHDTGRWLSTWIPWDDHMDVQLFLRNLHRELAAVGLAAARDVERNVRARIDEYKILNGLVEYEQYDAHSDMILPSTRSFSKSISGRKGSSSSMKHRSKRSRRADDFDSIDDGDDEESDDEDSVPASSLKKSARNKASSSASRISPLSSENQSASPSVEFIPGSNVRLNRPCPDCGVMVTAGEPNCPNCGVDFNLKGKGGVLGKGKKYCKSCNAIIPSSKRECPFCLVVCIK